MLTTLQRRWLLPVIAITAGLHGQSTLVAPPGLDNADGATRGKIAGFEARLRQQIIVKAEDLRQLEGSRITSLWFRRDRLLGLTYGSSSSALLVKMSPSRTTPLTASPVFADNATAPMATVFSGVVMLPPSQALPGTAPWSTPYAVELKLTPNYVHQAGDLCIEIEGSPQNPPPGFLWSVDYENEAAMGTVTSFGNPCGVAATRFRQTLGAWGRNMIPGGTFTISAVGVANSPGMLMLGAASAPMPLDGIGAPGCAVYVQPLATIIGLHGNPLGPAVDSALDTAITMPADTALLGGRFQVQAVNFEFPAQSNAIGITTTNALDITVAGQLPRGSVTTILSRDVGPNDPMPASGRVELGRGPVMRFEYQ